MAKSFLPALLAKPKSKGHVVPVVNYTSSLSQLHRSLQDEFITIDEDFREFVVPLNAAIEKRIVAMRSHEGRLYTVPIKKEDQ
jgi:hypothetical protein